MRTVAKFQFETANNAYTLGNDVTQIIDRWADDKFDHTADGGITIRRSGASALFDKRLDELDGARLTTFTILEPVEGGELQTLIRVLEGPKVVSFQCVLGVGSEGGVAPPNVSLRSPRFIREVINLGPPWTMINSSERLFSHSFPVGNDDADALEALLTSTDRRLPVVVVSELAGETLAGDLHERVATNVCGLAHTVRLSVDASWALTQRLGREWSCFNGAVRLFWPFRASRDDFHMHPLWTLDRIIARSETENIARDRFVTFITRKLIGASTFVADDPRIQELESAMLRNATETARSMAEGAGDYKSLAEAYAAENDILRRQINDQERELTDLRHNVETLTIVLRAAQTGPEEPTEDIPPATVAEAVATAKRELNDTIVIASETEKDWLDLNPSAGPPEKILRYLRTLGRMSSLLAEGTSLGVSIPIWLRTQNVECSVDSKTGKDAKETKAFRTRSIEGQIFDCEFHAKPSDGTSPDLCARIYFAIAEKTPKVRIGYIGRHMD